MSDSRLVPNIRFKKFEIQWSKYKFADMLDKNNGIRRGPFGSSLRKDSFVKKGDYVVYEQQNAIYNMYKTRYNINKSKFEELKKFELQPGDFIMSGAGTIGKISEVPEGITPGIFNQALIRFKINKKTTSRTFFLTFMRSYTMQRKLTEKNPGSAISNLVSMKEVKNFSIVIPDKQEQQKIGNFFTKLDKLLDLQQQKIDKLELLKKALLKKLFPKHDAKIPELRFKGFEDNWIIYSFSVLLIKNSSKNKNLEVENIESISNKKGFTKQSEQFDGYRVASLDLSNYYVIKENQFAYNPSRINVGSIAYKRKGEENCIISPLYVSFSTKNNINDTFLWFWFKTSTFKKQRIQFSEGGVRDTLPFENLKKMRIKLPRLNEQQKVGNLLSKVDQLIELENKKLQNFQQVKKCLLQNMFVE